MTKSIPLGELAQLKKLMAMTASTNDHEALAFLRKANAILSKYGLTWHDVLSRTVTAEAGPEPMNDEVSLKDEIQRAFDEVRGTASGSFADFLTSIENQFNATGYLSPAQRAPLYKSVRELRARRSRDS